MTGALLLRGRLLFLSGRFRSACVTFLVMTLTVVRMRRPVATGVAT